MKAEYVNAFVLPSIDVIKKMAKMDVKLGKISRLDNPESSSVDNNVSIIIGLKGMVSGTVIISTPNDVAQKLSAKVCNSPAEEISLEDIRAIMAEVANTIVGNATGLLYDIGITAGITPPTIVIGPHVSFSFDTGVESVKVPLISEVGVLQMVVSMIKDLN